MCDARLNIMEWFGKERMHILSNRMYTLGKNYQRPIQKIKI
jgi:hypothetical protein